MISRKRHASLFVALATYATLAGCGPAVPESFPPTSPAATNTPRGRTQPVTLAVDEDPPMPGDPGEARWSGLSPEHAEPPHSHSHPDHGAHPGAAPASPTIYTCPMHPEVTATAPGKCPKCGMNLTRRP